MLVLTRKLGERIHIGEDIEIVVWDLRATRVSLGITAPRDVVIMRGELEETAVDNETA